LLGHQKRAWQETDYVLSVFGASPAAGRRSYAAYVKAGSGQDRLKGDERILGDSDFVTSILAEANENLDRYYELKSRGYTIERVEEQVREIFGVEKEVIYRFIRYARCALNFDNTRRKIPRWGRQDSNPAGYSAGFP